MGYLGYNSICKVCVKKHAHSIYLLKAETIKAKTNEYKRKNKDIVREKSREYDKKNAEKIRLRKQRYRLENKEKIAKRRRIYLDNNKDKTNAYHSKKYHTDVNYRLKHILRSRIYNILKGRIKSGSAVKDLGCSVEKFKIYLETKFQLGMTWDNYGEWEIDHIIPLVSFNLENRKEFLKACNYKNLQPLWRCDNRQKSDKIT